MKLFASALGLAVLAMGSFALIVVRAQGLSPAQSAAASNANTGSAIAAKSSANAAASPLSNKTPAQALLNKSYDLNQVSATGILSDSASGHQKHGILHKALEGAVVQPANAAISFLFMGTDLPPDDASAPEWPFLNTPRKTLATVTWTDGSSAKMSRLPDGTYQILGGGKRYILQPEAEGSFALMGDYGSMATMSRRPGGGYVIIKADGHVEQVIPRQGGGFIIEDSSGVVATVLPGADSQHIMRGGNTGTMF